jgi:hypothetical protein
VRDRATTTTRARLADVQYSKRAVFVPACDWGEAGVYLRVAELSCWEIKGAASGGGAGQAGPTRQRATGSPMGRAGGGAQAR